jgi:hypothetical protein
MSIYKKLFEAKKEIGKISKDSTNPFFKSKYFDINGLLEHVEPILQKHELLLLQPISNGAVSTIIYDIDTENKNYMSSSIQLPIIQDPQKLGSAITYYRRYTLQSLLGLQAEDDDGNTATNQVKVESKPVLTDEQFAKCFDANNEDIRTMLNKCSMTKKQRAELTLIIK